MAAFFWGYRTKENFESNKAADVALDIKYLLYAGRSCFPAFAQPDT
jgi:hypothetical protein